MSASIPFIDPETRGLRTGQILNESYRVAGLVALFGGVALIPFVLTLAVGGGGLGVIFLIATQFVLVVGAAVVLMYVVARGIQLAGVETGARGTVRAVPDGDSDSN